MKKVISLFSLFALFCVVSWQLPNGLTFDDRSRTSKFGETAGDHGNSALWIRNLSATSAEAQIDANHGSACVSELIAGGATVRLDDLLPDSLSNGNDLVVRSNGKVALVRASADFPIDRSEFYHLKDRVDAGAVAPDWSIELEAIGKTGANLLKSGVTGHAPVVNSYSDVNKRYILGFAVALKKPNSSVHVKLLDSGNNVIKSVVLSGSIVLSSRHELGEFVSGTPDFPVRVEMSMLAGKGQAFLSIKDPERGETAILPVVPIRETAGDLQLACYGGTASFIGVGGSPGGTYHCAGQSFRYEVVNAPPNESGDLHTVRNNNPLVSGNWIQSNSSGLAQMGPWTVATGQNQTDTSIYIEWQPSLCRTVGASSHVSDGSQPSISSNQSGGSGVPSSFNGNASDVQWGSGFKFGGFDGWSTIPVTFQDLTTGSYWNGSSYSGGYREFQATPSPAGGGLNITWSIVPPPSSAHIPGHTYKWTVRIKDRCFWSEPRIITFTA